MYPEATKREKPPEYLIAYPVYVEAVNKPAYQELRLVVDCLNTNGLDISTCKSWVESSRKFNRNS